MSDLFEVREKTEKGATWRGDIQVEVDGDIHELKVRQLRDPEFWEVMSDIDTEELESVQADLDDEKMDELRELQEADDLDEEDKERLESIKEEVEEEDIDMFEVLSIETYQGLKQAAKYAIEPDSEDIRYALTEHTEDIKDMYGTTDEESARQYLNDHVVSPMVERSTNFTSFALGIRSLGKTLGDSGN